MNIIIQKSHSFEHYLYFAIATNLSKGLDSVTCISFDILGANLTVCRVSYLKAGSFERACDNSLHSELAIFF